MPRKGTLRDATAVAALLGIAISFAAMPAQAQTPPATPPAAGAPAQPTLGTWTQKAPLPGARAEVGVTQIDGKIYVIGGTDEKGVMTSWNSMYDPATDKWTERAPLPRPLHHIGVTNLNGKLYAIGGFVADVHMDPQPVAYVYDPKANKWSDLPNISAGRGSVAAVAVDGKVHIFGGRDSRSYSEIQIPNGPKFKVGNGTVRTHEIYDPKTNKWTKGTDIPEPSRDHLGVAVLDGKVHLFGGRIEGSDKNLDNHDVWDPKTDKWTSAAPLPHPRSAGAFTVLDGHIIYAGGECKPGGRPGTPNAFEETTSYDPKTNTWTQLTPLSQARHAYGAATVGKTAYFAAGSPKCGGGALAEMLALTLSPAKADAKH